MNQIYYFSGTGNSLRVANVISEQFADCEIIPISQKINQNSIELKGETVGIIYPVYYDDVPEVVEHFLKKVEVHQETYLYAIATLGSKKSGSFETINRLTSGQLSYGKHITMPSAQLRVYDVLPKGDALNALIRSSEKAIQEAIEDIKNREIINPSELQWHNRNPLYRIFRKPWLKSLPKIDSDFHTDANCNSCGICQKICPMNNIHYQDGQPVWNGQCQDCHGCINACPKRAIQIKNKTSKKKRYIHPNITLKALMINENNSN